ncbi:MAG: antitoxin family protein [Verrucomicrobia bacterium]|nr:antitoxin family protein [Verrucomicrobiota bacterium]
MEKKVAGIYENGVVRLINPVEVPAGTRVDVVFEQPVEKKANVLDFAGMLSDLTQGEWERFQNAVRRRPLFGN